jgi:hypothetical protein
MNSKVDDTIDLGPYFKLIKRFLQTVRAWLLRRAWLVVLLFALFVVIRVSLEQIKENVFVSEGVINSDIIPTEMLSFILNSLDANSHVGLNSEVFGLQTEKINSESIISKVHSEVYVSLKDSMLLSSNSPENPHLDQLSLDGPVNVTIELNTEFDSIGYYIMDYLIKHPAVTRYVQNSKIEMERRLKSLNSEISEVDSITQFILNSDSKSLAYDQKSKIFESKNNIVFDLIRYKGNLLINRDTILNDLSAINQGIIYTVADFSMPLKTDSVIPTDYKYFIKIFFLAILVSLVIDLLFPRKISNKA